MMEHSHKSIYVTSTKPTTEKKSIEFNFTKLREEYEKEGGEIGNWNMFSGGGIGASIGLCICLVTSLIGVPISSPDILAIVGGSLFLGAVAGYVLF